VAAACAVRTAEAARQNPAVQETPEVPLDVGGEGASVELGNLGQPALQVLLYHLIHHRALRPARTVEGGVRSRGGLVVSTSGRG